jgi:heme exporter protein CcmD
MIATYAEYIWPCYIATAVVLVLNVWLARRKLAQELQNTKRSQQMKAQESP